MNIRYHVELTAAERCELTARNGEETRRQHGMQHKDTEIEAQEFAVGEHLAEQTRHRFRIAMDFQRRRMRDRNLDDGNSGERQPDHQPEDTRDTD